MDIEKVKKLAESELGWPDPNSPFWLPGARYHRVDESTAESDNDLIASSSRYFIHHYGPGWLVDGDLGRSAYYTDAGYLAFHH